MVNSESLSDIFSNVESELSNFKTTRGISLAIPSHSKVKVCVSKVNVSLTEGRSDSELVKSESSAESSSWCLHLSEESNNNEHSGENSAVQESSSSDETYISLNTPSLSFEDHKCNILNNELSSDKNVYTSTPDMFADSQENPSFDAVKELFKPSVTKIKVTEYHEPSEDSSNEYNIQELLSSRESSLTSRTSSDTEGHSQALGIFDHEGSSHDSQFSQEKLQYFSSPMESSTPLDCREREEEWTTEELHRVTQRLELRRKQAKRLILTVIRKRQMAEETLDAFKKRLKRF